MALLAWQRAIRGERVRAIDGDRWSWSAVSIKKKKSGALHQPIPPSFGEDVRRVRTARGLTLKHLGRGAGYSEGHVSKVEAGLVVPTLRFAEGCDRTFGTGDLFVQQLKRLTEGEHPSWFAPYIDAEREAETVCDFSSVFVMGLLQTPEYAQSVFAKGVEPLSEEEVEAQITSRLRRREVFDQSQPPRVFVVLHEACLRAQMGSARVMAGQLTHILALLETCPTLTVQVLPYSAGGAALNYPFSILYLPDSSPVVYSEGPSGGRPFDTAEVVSRSQRYFNHLRSYAVDPHDSKAYLRAIKDDHERDVRVDEVQLQRLNRGPVRRVGPGTRVRRRRPRPRQ